MEEKNIIAGRNPVIEYLRASQQSAERLVVANSAHGKIIEDILRLAANKKIKIQKEERGFFKKFGPSSAHQGVVLFLSAGAPTLHKEKDLAELTAEQKGVLVLLDHISDPHNAGAIIRTAEALGCTGVVIPGSNAAGITPTVVKASAGATAHIPVVNIVNVAAFIEHAKQIGLWVIGTSGSGTLPVSQTAKYKPALVIIGSEGGGMRRLTEEKCDYVTTIPLKGKIESLNASVAAGIILHEIMKDV